MKAALGELIIVVVVLEVVVVVVGPTPNPMCQSSANTWPIVDVATRGAGARPGAAARFGPRRYQSPRNQSQSTASASVSTVTGTPTRACSRQPIRTSWPAA